MGCWVCYIGSMAVGRGGFGRQNTPAHRHEFATVRLATLRVLAQRFSMIFLVLAAIALMLFEAIQPRPIEAVRTRVVDAFTPMLDAFSRPAATVAQLIEAGHDLWNTYLDNRRLEQDNARLLQWKQAALRLEAENNSLKSLLQYKPGPGPSYVSARVVATSGGPFLRAVTVTAGRRHGIRKGQAAMAGPGMVGRVVEVGEWSSRVLLLTDINTRIPVTIQRTRHRGILAGDSTDEARLLYLLPEAGVAVGDQLVTSGDGGLFPPGLAVGTVTEVGDHGVKVRPVVPLDRLEHMLLVNFGLPGGLTFEDGALP